jgi:hypothetical protein
MKIGIIIPDRGDRPAMLENCLRMMKNQTLQPYIVCLMEYPPESDQCDITQRYRRGYNHLCGKGLDLIALIENDDWYATDYLEQMVNKWLEHGSPDLFGTNYTIYYHLALDKYFTFKHDQRSSAMSTFIRPDLDITWPKDHDPYTDQWLWIGKSGISSRMAIKPDKVICIGMKHGLGKTGGDYHTSSLKRYIIDGGDFLKNTLDPVSFKFYSSLFSQKEI